MMQSMAATAGAVLYKRATDSGDVDNPKQVSGWVFLVVLANVLVFLPVVVYMSYTLGQLFPALAIVENTDPPAYEPVALNDEADNANAAPRSDAGKPISSSLRALSRLLYSVAGWRASFRGLGACVAYLFAISVVTGIFTAIPFVPAEVGTLLAALALVQLSTAWVHIAISPPNPAYFWRRLPPFRKAFEATWIPTVVACVAGTAAGYVPQLAALVVGLPLVDPSKPGEIPEYDRHASWKVLVVLLVTLVAWALVIVPAEVLLIRVQASLLPPDEDTIIPFDRTYGGTLEPAVVGKGYVSVRDALGTFPRSSWVRIYILHAKIFAAVLLAYGVMLAVIVPQALLFKL
ncbi:Ubiquitin conjugating [Coniochaeta hoffmannii]|uniref:Ubiquitin conjugating n=1 Tax=Coniochaeta hoffmannii TaxID=91930 RepID=A0AA38VXZ5_9PEZI|nr:Ubiquitin conjugating [Coniochaeta hoffmannii]